MVSRAARASSPTAAPRGGARGPAGSGGTQCRRTASLTRARNRSLASSGDNRMPTGVFLHPADRGLQTFPVAEAGDVAQLARGALDAEGARGAQVAQAAPVDGGPAAGEAQ